MIKKILIGIGLSLIGLIIIALALLPVTVKSYAVKHSAELVGRRMHIQKLRVIYFGGKIRITDFILFEEDGEETFASFDTLMVHLRPLKLLKDELVIRQFYLSGLYASLIRYDSAFNFSDLIAYHSGGPETDSLEETKFKYYLSDIELKHARFDYENKPVGDTVQLRDLSFFIPYFGWTLRWVHLHPFASAGRFPGVCGGNGRYKQVGGSVQYHP